MTKKSLKVQQVKIGKLFIEFQTTLNAEWDEKTVAAYEELRGYALNYVQFVKYRDIIGIKKNVRGVCGIRLIYKYICK